MKSQWRRSIGAVNVAHDPHILESTSEQTVGVNCWYQRYASEGNLVNVQLEGTFSNELLRPEMDMQCTEKAIIKHLKAESSKSWIVRMCNLHIGNRKKSKPRKSH